MFALPIHCLNECQKKRQSEHLSPPTDIPIKIEMDWPEVKDLVYASHATSIDPTKNKNEKHIEKIYLYIRISERDICRE